MSLFLSILLFSLLALNVFLPAAVGLSAAIKRDGIEVNHLLLFSFGYVFYWIMPIGIGLLRLFSDEPGMILWYRIFDAISPETLAIYLVLTFLCYLGFWSGSLWGRFITARKPLPFRSLFFYPRLLDMFFACGLIAAAVFGIGIRGHLFHGYLEIGTEAENMEIGSFTAASIFLLSLAFLHSAKQNEGVGKKRSVRELFLTPYFALYFLVAFLVLSTGGRLYFLSSIIMLLIYWSAYYRPIPTKAALVTFAVLAGAAGLVGTLRLNGPVSISSVFFNLLAEPLFTSFTLTNFLRAGTFDLLRAPVFLISDFMNLVPSFLLPSKADLRANPEDYGFSVFAPLGATNSFFSFMINFGVVGTIAALFLIGWLYSYLRQSDRTLLHRVSYVMLSGWLGFTFFRDDFSISVIKSMFQFSVALPILMVIALQLVSVYLRNLKPVNTEKLKG
jgi:hypothetical protein